ncbi:MAG: type II secretion system protein [Phycisphaerae bacterium]|nr:type II secretion system protein [Phycisphaerae bacterium]
MSADAAATVTGATFARSRRRAWREWIGRRCVDFVLGLILLAGVTKSVDVPAFESTLSSWTLIPPVARPIVAHAAPLCELAVGCLWFSGVARKAAPLLGLGLLSAYTTLYVFQLATAMPPTCSCLALIDRYWSDHDLVPYTIGRNCVFIALLAVGMCWSVERARRQPTMPSAGVSARGVRLGRSGFTLQEILVTCCVIGILAAVVLPSIVLVRGAARNAASLSHLRTHAQVFAGYATDYQDMLPYFTPPESSTFRMMCQSRGEVSGPHFATHVAWNYGMADRAYGGNPNHETFYSPARARTGGTSYYYGCAFLASPEYWNPSTRVGPAQWGAAHLSSAVYPSKKMLMMDYAAILESQTGGRAWQDPSIALRWAGLDGSATSSSLAEIAAGYEEGDGNFPGLIHLVDYPFGMHTIGGVRGRDVP